MKIIVLVVLFAAVCFFLGCGDGSGEGPAVLSINDIQSDPLAFVGEITISGVAAAFSETDGDYFGVMDTAELIACKDLNCGAFTLSARYAGEDPLPDLADIVDITGSFEQNGNDIYFAVRNFEVRRNIMNLLSD